MPLSWPKSFPIFGYSWEGCAVSHWPQLPFPLTFVNRKAQPCCAFSIACLAAIRAIVSSSRRSASSRIFAYNAPAAALSLRSM